MNNLRGKKSLISSAVSLMVLVLVLGVSEYLGRVSAESYPYNTNVNLMARTIYAEAHGEPYVGQVAVGAVIMNRLQNPRFPHTIAGVVYQPWAFESVALGLIYRNNPDRTAISAARAAIAGWDPSGGALYYWNPSKPVKNWIWTRRIIKHIGHHVFAV